MSFHLKLQFSQSTIYSGIIKYYSITTSLNKIAELMLPSMREKENYGLVNLVY